MTLTPILLLTGMLLLQFGLLMLVPTALMYLDASPGASGFLMAALTTCMVGALMAAPGLRRPFELRSRQLFAATTFSWVAMSFAAALPFLFGPPHVGLTNAVFEAVSGITTTGSTVLVGLEYMPRGVLLWRSLIQWVGGIGFIVMGIAILPFLRVGGMRLFHTESSDWSDKAVPRTNKLASAIGIVYVGLTALCALLYWVGGMSIFDAICHSMTTLSTGGFSTYDASFGHFADRPFLIVVCTVFMLAGGLPFVLYVQAMRGTQGLSRLLRDEQVRGVVAFTLMASALVTLHLVAFGTHDVGRGLLTATFHVVSVLTTTGYASEDYGTWGHAVVIMFLMLMFVGTASGSTSGGMKMFRMQLGFAVLYNQLRGLVHPRGVFTIRFNRQPVPDEVLRSVLGFAFFFFITVAGVALTLGVLGLDPITSLSSAVTAVANVGPGLGPIVGPAGNFLSLPDAAKWILCVGMILGRLEIMTVIVLLTPEFWRG